MNISINGERTHEMKLHSNYFYEVITGKKEVEFRMLDTKRKLIKVGDYIVFKNINTDEVCAVKVTKLETYCCFFTALFHTKYIDSTSNPCPLGNANILNDLMRIYKDKLGKSEVLAIYFE